MYEYTYSYNFELDFLFNMNKHVIRIKLTSKTTILPSIL